MCPTRIAFIVFLSFFLNSCEPSLTANVEVLVIPYGSGSDKYARQPIIFSSSGPQICRFRPYRIRDLREVLRSAGANEEFLEVFLGEEGVNRRPEEEGEGQEERARSNEPARTTVSGHWIEFGLKIANHTEAYYLIVEYIRAIGVARCGEENFTFQTEITPSYCSEGGGAAPFLYFVPGGHKVDYLPASNDPLKNLKIIIDGIPAIDRSSAGSASLTGNNVSQPSCRPRELIAIPDYIVELNLIGHFRDRSGNDVGRFEKTVSFFTTPQRGLAISR